jgi:hypothetical protein
MPKNGVPADSEPPPVPSSPCRMSPRGTMVLLVVFLGVAAALILLSILVPIRRTVYIDCGRREEQALDPDIRSFDNDPFDFSLLRYSGGFFFLYSYKNRNTNATKGPRILVRLVEERSGFSSSSDHFNAYSWEYESYMTNNTDAFSFELTIGKNASDASIAWAGLKDKEDGNVTIDPSVVHLRFSNNATYNIYNDTVFFVSFRPRSGTLTLHVQQRAMNLTETVSSVCGLYGLYQRAEWKALLNEPFDTA